MGRRVWNYLSVQLEWTHCISAHYVCTFMLNAKRSLTKQKKKSKGMSASTQWGWGMASRAATHLKVQMSPLNQINQINQINQSQVQLAILKKNPNLKVST